MRRPQRSATSFWVIGAVAAVTVALVVLAHAHGHEDFWSVAVPGVLTGFGTLGLAAVTFAVLLGDQRDRRKRDAQDQRRDEQERRAQAARVNVSEAEQHGPATMVNSADATDVAYHITIFNESADAIGEVVIALAVDPPDARADMLHGRVHRFARVLPGDRKSVSALARVHIIGQNQPVPHRLLVYATFRDSAGVMWARDNWHRLLEIDDDQVDRMIDLVESSHGYTNAGGMGEVDPFGAIDPGFERAILRVERDS